MRSCTVTATDARPQCIAYLASRYPQIATLVYDANEPPPASLHLPWLPFPISAVALSWLVDGLILVSALLLFAVVCMAMIGAVPPWPITLALGVGVAAVLTATYRFLFFLLIGGTPGYCLAGRTSDPGGKIREPDERPRFR